MLYPLVRAAAEWLSGKPGSLYNPLPPRSRHTTQPRDEPTGCAPGERAPAENADTGNRTHETRRSTTGAQHRRTVARGNQARSEAEP